MKFKQWLELQEAGTTTADIAGFARICMPMVTRTWPPHWGQEPDRKKKVKRQPQVDESILKTTRF